MDIEPSWRHQEQSSFCLVIPLRIKTNSWMLAMWRSRIEKARGWDNESALTRGPKSQKAVEAPSVRGVLRDYKSTARPQPLPVLEVKSRDEISIPYKSDAVFRCSPHALTQPQDPTDPTFT
ncbi:hypothetical protein PV11_04533 [Exophiala sideris]|uniref:Uncharacterized protein n=1 Tax=Exophiala sideris TaxID=1016849 RepID=A0A0D1Z6C6_9EURO|nr:hypothetical protein PV11_04533 [Exophiala sideris]